LRIKARHLRIRVNLFQFAIIFAFEVSDVALCTFTLVFNLNSNLRIISAKF